MRCTQYSDTDLAIRLKETSIDNETKNSISEVVQEICNWNADILWYDIRANLNILNRLNIDIPCEKELRTFASTLYSWETESRYKDSFIAAVKDIDEIFVIAQTLIGYITSKIEPIDVEEVEFPVGRL